MDETRRRRITEIFEDVRVRPVEERSTHLERACSGDEELRRGVEELLDATATGPTGRAPDTLVRVRVPGEKIPSKIGKYEIVRRIGQGGFGEVFLGHDPVIKRQVAVKLCSSADESLRRRFFREVEIAGSLQHSNITTVHDSGSYGETPYLVQEYLPGEDLAQQIRERRSTPPTTRIGYLIQVARGLRYAHEQGVVHRDVKPSNLRVLDDGSVKILDFGIARLLAAETRLTQTGTRLGTMCYMAPEQLRGETADPRADVFAFGVVAYELLTYTHPFQADTSHGVMYQVLEAEPRPLTDLWPRCPPHLADCVARCLEKHRDDRYPDMDEVLGELKEVALDLGAMPTAVTAATTVRSAARPARRPPRRRRSPRVPWLVAAGLAVVAAVALYFALGNADLSSQEPQASPPPETVAPEPPPPAPPAEIAPFEEATQEDPVEAPPPVVVPPPPVPPPAPPPPAEPAPSPPDKTPEIGIEEAAEASVPEAAPAATVAVEAPPPPVPVVLGEVTVNALPWATIERIVAVDGTEHEPRPSRYTPLALTLPAGAYEIVLSRAGAGERSCRVEIGVEATATCLERFARVQAASFFEMNRPPGGPGGDRRPPPLGGRPPPHPEGRPPPREELPKWLKEAAQAYFDGDYDLVPGMLAEGLAANEKKRKKKRLTESTVLYTRLFQGASLYALYLLGGEKESAFVDAAAEELRQCRAIRPSFMPHADYFSPRLIELYSVSVPSG